MSRIGKSVEPENKLMVALGWEEGVGNWGVTAGGHGVPFRGDEGDLH